MRPADEKPTVADFDFDARDVGGQVVVYDHSRGMLHILDWATAYVWYLCDGTHTADDMARVMTEESGQRVGVRVVRHALGELETAHMIDRTPRSAAEGEAWRERRDFLLRAAAVVGGAVVAPAILTVGGATPAAASTVPLVDRLRNRFAPPSVNVDPTTTTTSLITTTSTSTGPPPTTTSTSTGPPPTTTSTSTGPPPTTTSTSTAAPPTTTSTSTAAPTTSTTTTTTLGPSLPPGVREAIEAIIDSLERFGETFRELIEELDDILSRFRPSSGSFLSR